MSKKHESGISYGVIYLNRSEKAVRDYFRLVDDDILHTLIDSVKAAENEEEQKKIVHEFCENEKPEWKYQANHLISQYNLK